jgi:hypothetical protein
LPGRGALIRLAGAVLAEQHDEQTELRRHIGLDILPRGRQAAAASEKAGEVTLAGSAA